MKRVRSTDNAAVVAVNPDARATKVKRAEGQGDVAAAAASAVAVTSLDSDDGDITMSDVVDASSASASSSSTTTTTIPIIDPVGAYDSLLRSAREQAQYITPRAGEHWTIQTTAVEFRVLLRSDATRTTPARRVRRCEHLRRVSFFELTNLSPDADADDDDAYLHVPADMPYAECILSGAPLPDGYDVVGALKTWVYYNFDIADVLECVLFAIGASEASFEQWFERVPDADIPEPRDTLGEPVWCLCGDLEERAPGAYAMLACVRTRMRAKPRTAFELGACGFQVCTNRALRALGACGNPRVVCYMLERWRDQMTYASYRTMLVGMLTQTEYARVPLVCCVTETIDSTDWEKLVFDASILCGARDVLDWTLAQCDHATAARCHGFYAQQSWNVAETDLQKSVASFVPAQAALVRALTLGHWDVFRCLQAVERQEVRLPVRTVYACLALACKGSLLARVSELEAEAEETTTTTTTTHTGRRIPVDVLEAAMRLPAARTHLLPFLDVHRDTLTLSALVLYAVDALGAPASTTIMCAAQHALQAGKAFHFFRTCFELCRTDLCGALWKIPHVRRLVRRNVARARTLHAVCGTDAPRSARHLWHYARLRIGAPNEVAEVSELTPNPGGVDGDARCTHAEEATLIWGLERGVVHVTREMLARVLPRARTCVWRALVECGAAGSARAPLADWWCFVCTVPSAEYLTQLGVRAPPHALERNTCLWKTLGVDADSDVDVDAILRLVCTAGGGSGGGDDDDAVRIPPAAWHILDRRIPSCATDTHIRGLVARAHSLRLLDAGGTGSGGTYPTHALNLVCVGLVMAVHRLLSTSSDFNSAAVDTDVLDKWASWLCGTSDMECVRFRDLLADYDRTYAASPTHRTEARVHQLFECNPALRNGAIAFARRIPSTVRLALPRHVFAHRDVFRAYTEDRAQPLAYLDLPKTTLVITPEVFGCAVAQQTEWTAPSVERFMAYVHARPAGPRLTYLGTFLDRTPPHVLIFAYLAARPETFRFDRLQREFICAHAGAIHAATFQFSKPRDTLARLGCV
jgi:hypothetical protein